MTKQREELACRSTGLPMILAPPCAQWRSSSRPNMCGPSISIIKFSIGIGRAALFVHISCWVTSRSDAACCVDVTPQVLSNLGKPPTLPKRPSMLAAPSRNRRRLQTGPSGRWPDANCYKPSLLYYSFNALPMKEPVAKRHHEDLAQCHDQYDWSHIRIQCQRRDRHNRESRLHPACRMHRRVQRKTPRTAS